jgi:hypothetical protein
MFVRASSTATPVLPVNMRCPECGMMGTFEGAGGLHDAVAGWSNDPGSFSALSAGHRRCPNPGCQAHVFVVLDRRLTTEEQLVRSYPPVSIDFDPTGLPGPLLDTLEEAIRCHAAGCYRASAAMVRRTLEELCADRRAEGESLHKRLQSLTTQVALPSALVEGLGTLKLLGNDAVHVELKDFDAVGPTEATLAIDVLKKILEAVYQHDALVARLDALKRPT